MLSLRPYKPADAEKIASWCNSEDVFYKWGGDRFGAFPLSAEIINHKYMQQNGDCTEPDNFYPMVAVDDGEAVGHFIIRYTQGDPRMLRFGWVLVDASKRGKGYGRSMLMLGLKMAFEIMGARKVTIGVFDINASAYRCYKSIGFTEAAEQPGETKTVGDATWTVIELETESPDARI